MTGITTNIVGKKLNWNEGFEFIKENLVNILPNAIGSISFFTGLGGYFFGAPKVAWTSLALVVTSYALVTFQVLRRREQSLEYARHWIVLYKGRDKKDFSTRDLTEEERKAVNFFLNIIIREKPTPRAWKYSIRYEDKRAFKYAIEYAARFSELQKKTSEIEWGANDLSWLLNNAVKSNFPNLAPFLITIGANPNGIFKHSFPLDAAMLSKNEEVIEQLVKGGALRRSGKSNASIQHLNTKTISLLLSIRWNRIKKEGGIKNCY